MQRARNARGNNNPSRQQAGGRAQANTSMELETLRREVSQLNDLLNQERAHCNKGKEERVLLVAELEDTKQQLAKQKSLKEMHSNRGIELNEELKRLQKYRSYEALSAAKIATQVRDTTRHKKKKDLHADYEELQVAHLISTEKFATELQGEKEKNGLLQKQLDQMKVSQLELSLKYETDILGARQQAESLQRELQQQMQAHADSTSQDQQVILTLKAEQDTLSQRMAEEVAVVQQRAFEEEKIFRRDLNKFKTIVQKIIQEDYEQFRMENQLSRERFTAELQEQKEITRSLQEELERSRDSNQQLSQRYEQDVLSLRQQAENFQRHLETQEKSHSDQLLESQLLICSMRAEHEAPCKKTAEEIDVMQQQSAEKESRLLTEPQELQAQLHVQLQKNDELSEELQAEREDCMLPQRKSLRREEQPEEHMFLEVNLAGASAAEAAEELEVSDVTVSKVENRPSIWKRFRHFLGLRKPQRWKNK